MPSVRCSSRDERGFQVVRSALAFRERVLFAQDHPWANILYVDSISGSDSYNGLSPDRAKATIQAAIDAAVAGDKIYINPKRYIVGTGMGRYDELLTVALAQSDLSIIGVRNFDNTEFGVRIYNATASYVLTSAAPCLHLENLAFFANTLAYGSLILQNNGGANTQRNDGCTIYNCNFKVGTTGKGVMIQGGQATRIENSVFNHAAAGKLTIATPAVSGYNQQIVDCTFLDNNGVAPVECDIQAGGANVYSLKIKNCDFLHLIPTTEAYYINCPGAQSTGLIKDCGFNDPDIAIATDVILTAAGIDIVGSHDGSGAFIA